jgi:hypothetical protein
MHEAYYGILTFDSYPRSQEEVITVVVDVDDELKSSEAVSDLACDWMAQPSSATTTRTPFARHRLLIPGYLQLLIGRQWTLTLVFSQP